MTVLVGEEIQPCWRKKYITGVGFESLYPCSTSGSLSLLPIGVGDVITQLSAPASCCSAFPANLPPEPKVKEKKNPLPSINLLWPWGVGTATEKRGRQGVEQNSGCSRASHLFDVDSGCGVWSRGLGG